MTAAYRTDDDDEITVRIPFSLRKRGGRKLVVAPDGTTNNWTTPRLRVDAPMIKAIARAFRWRNLLESGAYTTIAEIAAAENINASYVGRVLRLTLLAPDIIDAIMDGRQPARLQLEDLCLRRFSVVWPEQRIEILGTAV